MSAEDEQNRPRRRGKAPAIRSEDHSLWQRIAASIRPLSRAKPRVPEVEIEPLAPARTTSPKPKPVPPAKLPPKLPPKSQSKPPEPRARATPAKPSDGSKSRQGPPRAPAKTTIFRPTPATPPRWTPPVEAAPSLPGLERRRARRIASGAIEIDARLDLHGLTQSTAHDRLVSFLQSAATQGLKTVLVITGKGGPRTSRRGRESAFEDEAEVGVLRRSVPRWLAEASLRHLVISCQPASQRHGGEGAFYILLRRAKGGAPR